MAGIGFRLKRLLAEDTCSAWLTAHVYGAMISSGPWLLSFCTVATLAFVSRGILAGAEHDLFSVIVVYTYTFSLITTGALSMVASRRLADLLYSGDVRHVLGAYRVAVGITALSHLALACVFYGLAPDLGPGVRVGGAVLFVVVSCTWIAMIFVGAAQHYGTIIGGFFAGSLVSLCAALTLGSFAGLPGYLAGFVLGQAVIFFVLTARLERDFAAGAGTGARALLDAFRRYPALSAAGVLYGAALAIDRVVFWGSGAGLQVTGWFYRSSYDTPLFLAYLSVVPSLATFLVSVETEFHDRYRRYYGAVTHHGTLRQVLAAKADMVTSLREGLARILRVQLPVTLGMMLVAPWIGDAFALEPVQVGILRVALVGAALHVLSLFGLVALLYFDRRRAALEIAAILLAVNFAATLVTVALGPRTYGLGFAVAALAASLWAYHRLEQTIDDLEYLTFASQPLTPTVE